MNTSDVYECISIAKEKGFTEPARAAVRQMDEVFVTVAQQAARIAELEAALSNARIALTFYREWMLAQDENACTRYPFGVDAENVARELLKGG